MRGKIILSYREAQGADVLGQVAQGALSLREAAVLIGISYRQARRVNQRYREQGVAGLARGGRGRPAANAIDNATRPSLAARAVLHW